MKNTENIMLSQLQMTTYFSLFEMSRLGKFIYKQKVSLWLPNTEEWGK